MSPTDEDVTALIEEGRDASVYDFEFRPDCLPERRQQSGDIAVQIGRAGGGADRMIINNPPCPKFDPFPSWDGTSSLDHGDGALAYIRAQGVKNPRGR